MKTSYSFITTAALCMSAATFAQLPRIVVQGNGAPQVFTDINAAITAAQPNDYVYLSGGSFHATANLVIDKPLHLVGAGMHPDSTGVTGTTTLGGLAGVTIYLTTAASGSSFTGMVMGNTTQYGTMGDGSDDDPTNVVFQRCQFPYYTILSQMASSASSSTTFDECLFNGALSGGGGTAVITRSIFSDNNPYNFGNGSPGSLTMQNCVLVSPSGTGTGITGIGAGTFLNCVLECTFYQVGATFNNCLLTASALPPGSVGSGNTFGLAQTAILSNESDGYYQFTDDMHLAAGSPGHNAGADGTDIGLYGSASPYKPGAVPVNPHYRLANIANATDGSGNLPVSIKVAAQGN